MELPLVLRRARSGALVYAIPLWYRVLAALVAAVLVSAILVSGGTGPLGWVLLAVALLALLYEERWILDRKAETVTWRFGLLVAARTRKVPFAEVLAIRLEPFHKGVLDQSKVSEEDAAKPVRGRRTEWRLYMDLEDGDTLVLDSGNPRRRDRLNVVAHAMAEELDIAYAAD